MAKVEDYLDIYYAVRNENTQRQENEPAPIMKKYNCAVWKLISRSTAIVDTKKQFSNLYLFFGKELVINTVEIWSLSPLNCMYQKLLIY